MSVTEVLVYVIFALISFLLYKCKNLLDYWKIRGVPHEKPHWIFGNFKGVGTQIHLRDVYRRIYNKYHGMAPFAGFHFLLNPCAMIMDLELVKSVMIKDFNNFADRGMFVNERDDPLSGHLFNLNGSKWRDIRQKLSPTFTSGKMKLMFGDVLDISKRLVSTLPDFRDGDSVVEMKDLFARYTTDVIGTCAFGIECNSLKDPNAEFRQMGIDIFAKPRHNKFGNLFIASFPKLAAKLRMKFNRDTTTDFFMKVVRETVEYRENNGIRRNDFVNMLIDLKNTEKSITMNELVAQVFVFYIAGFDTSSSTLGFALYELAIHQQIQDKVRAEIENVLGDDELTYESTQSLPYLDQVINETLRKYAVIPAITRRALVDYQVPNTDLVIEKDTLVVIPADAIHHDAELYPEPEKFDPARFSPDAVKDRHPCAFLPFGDGPRNCIGLRFGKMQVRIGLVELLRKFKFSVTSKTEFPLAINLTTVILLMTQNGIYLKAENVK